MNNLTTDLPDSTDVNTEHKVHTVVAYLKINGVIDFRFITSIDGILKSFLNNNKLYIEIL